MNPLSKRLLTALACLLLGAGCAGPKVLPLPGLVVTPGALDVPPPGDPYGHAETLKQRAVYLFSQAEVNQTDAQVLAFSDAVLIRGWQKWQTHGLKASDYDFSYPAKAQQRKIAFVAGGTASVLFRDEAGEHFADWATRDARNALVEHAYIVPGAHRASLANPAYRQHLIAYGKLQIDGGVDGLFFDEFNAAGYTGGKTWQFNGNEGYDDYFLADFNAFLAKKHPDFGAEEWAQRYGMHADNRIRDDVPLGDLTRNFNYRNYLASHGWANYPDEPKNPLAPVWGALIGNRSQAGAQDFRARAFDHYWREVVASLREYARQRHGKEILITSNGVFPYVDFNSFGLYEYNRDDKGKEVEWLPVVNGHLDGSRSYRRVFQQLYAYNREVAGDVPLVLFLDWPTAQMNAYYALSVAEKRDFWRIYAAEAYASGLYYAFHLKTAMPGEPTAQASGVLEFLKQLAGFYAAHAPLYAGARPLDTLVSTSVAQITATLTTSQKKTLLHLVNHNYQRGLLRQRQFTTSFPYPEAPQRVTRHSPDAEGARPLAFRFADNTLTVEVDELEAYDLIVIE